MLDLVFLDLLYISVEKIDENSKENPEKVLDVIKNLVFFIVVDFLILEIYRSYYVDEERSVINLKMKKNDEVNCNVFFLDEVIISLEEKKNGRFIFIEDMVSYVDFSVIKILKEVVKIVD